VVLESLSGLDYGAITDVRLTFYYKARYDPGLHDKVLAQLAALPNYNARQRGIPLRWLYPDAFFKFQDTGKLTFTLRARDFPRNQTKPLLDQVGVVIVTNGSVSAAGLKLALTTPGKTAATGRPMRRARSNRRRGRCGSRNRRYHRRLRAQMTAANNPSLVAQGKPIWRRW
jgi:hypothetical protein